MASTRQVLGLDLGTNSVGWAVLEETLGNGGKWVPTKVVNTGARVFEQSVEGSIEDGKDVPLATERREKRQVRRQLDRRSMRRINTMRCLLANGLLPMGDSDTGKQRQELINSLDVQLRDSMLNDGRKECELNELPYFLRAIALDIELPYHAFGRAIYHLCQRRGFKSNRKDKGSADEKPGEVKKEIGELAEKMAAKNCRTLGEYFYSLDPHETRIRKRWTGREMYEHEFDAIWDKQQSFNPEKYTDALREELRDCIFHQRPLKSQKGLVGRCELEPQKRRASMGILAAQEFRYLQKINDLRFKGPDGVYEDLTADQKIALREAFERGTEYDSHHLMSWAKIRKILGLKKKDGVFNHEEGGEKHLPGNKTAGRIRAVIGEKWDALEPGRQKDLVGELMGGASDERMRERLRDIWGFGEEESTALSGVSPEDAYCALSKRALNKILPLMREGVHFATARNKVYGDTGHAGDHAFGFLPPLEGFIDPKTGESPPENPPKVIKNGKEKVRLQRHKVLSIRNPVVNRVLSEVRVVVNAIIREYGKPDMIRLEMARDIKKPRVARAEIAKNNRSLRKERDKARDFLTKTCGIQHPKREDVDKYMLWKECNETCPYTGKRITRQALFGNNSQYDIEHIIPFSRCLDNSFVNKTLCYHEENRNVKGNKSPFEAYSGDEQKWEEMLARVKEFKGDRGDAKLKRFVAEDLSQYEDFTERHLNDTRYAAKEAKKYLGLLYGPESRSRIQVSTGTMTSGLRAAWDLNSILNDGGPKSREDHRHHAVDAIVVGLITPGMVKQISTAAGRARKELGTDRRWFKKFPEPWEGFYQDCVASIDEIVVSHKPNRKVRGALHEETNYGRQMVDEETGKEYAHIRKALGDLFKQSDINNIVDPSVREAVQAHFDKHGGDSKKAFGDIANHPVMNGIPIHRVRIRKNTKITPIGSDKNGNQRQVLLGNNHHVEVIEFEDKKGNTKWDFVVVDMFTCMQRVKRGEPVVQRDHGEGKRFVMSLCKGDFVLMEDTEGVERLYVVRKFDKNGIMFFKSHRDARLAKDIPAIGHSRRAGSFKDSNPRKVNISPLGRIFPVND